MVHPVYFGNAVMVYADSGRLTDFDPIDQQLSLFQYDLTASELAALPPSTLRAVSKLPWGVLGFIPFIRAMLRKVPLPRKGVAMEVMMWHHGPPINLELNSSSSATRPSL
mmetsp:Transcript_5877/g.13296  ORF Transcript_5877/g.13296 Transcript_5877/m.13296 type:complete len:110 (-) Transcript_5877:68-397(-)